MKHYSFLLNHYHSMIRWCEKEGHAHAIPDFEHHIEKLIEEAQQRMENRPTWKKLLRKV